MFPSETLPHHNGVSLSSHIYQVPIRYNQQSKSQLIRDLKHTEVKIESLDEGIEMLKRYLSSCNALIIVDVVDHPSQLDAILLPIKEILHPSSLILVTSRDKHVLRNAGILEVAMYKL